MSALTDLIYAGSNAVAGMTEYATPLPPTAPTPLSLSLTPPISFPQSMPLPA